ncbi:polysaccharide lyase family 8 super-sandwich domain-containing protein [Chitinophaga alhagiae]|uniref:polysaccharide lyase family 8 super-sandwich domain-containing protein n=1 Tax=Chitinophaga alhagiae TaxID=2203219 RepID=UPI001E3F8740|nr:polysaccharide lyase family 8 super-sandwich domain-containing protein [Chitinophaga alhagiae]
MNRKMIKRLFALTALLCILSAAAHAQLDTIVNRYKTYLLRTGEPQPAIAQNWAATLNANGQWPDVPYNDKELSGWKVTLHLARVRDMALAWAHPASAAYHQPQLLEKAGQALDHWLARRYQSANWWHNEIGVPRYMRDIIVLLRGQMDTARLRQSLEVMAQLRVHENYVGSNLIWCADLGLNYAALTGNEKMVQHCLRLILKEIQISTGEGVKPDQSFYQHGARLQMYQYGEAFLTESVRVAWQLRGTPQAFPQEKIDILSNFALKGWQWMGRGIHTVPGTMDRSSSRVGEMHGAELRPTIPFLAELQPHEAAALARMAAIQNGKGALNGHRHYPYADFTAYHRPGFSMFLKTISTRTLATESINNENLKGRLLNSGDAYLVRNGLEYYNMMPVWDYTALPGITAFKGADHIARRPFTGGVSDSTSGLTAMDYDLQNKTGNQRLTARKYWAFHGNMAVCLMAGLQAQGITGDVYTALDQCRVQGPVTINKAGRVLQPGVHPVEQLKWVHHAGFAYIPLQPAAFNIRLEEVTGAWSAVNASEPATPVTEKVFSPVMLHRGRPNTGYALAFCEKPAQAAKLAKRPQWKVLRNDTTCQAVLFKDGTLMAAFYAPGEAGGIAVDQPCLVMRKKNNIHLSDPAQKGITVNVTVRHTTKAVTLPKDGFAVKLAE